jgi:outer membrane lipoprotein-sorting protein
MKILAIPCMLLVAGAAHAQATLADVQKALAATTTMTATFTQTAADGRQASGTMLLKRPGRIRFDYGKDASYLVVSDGQRLSFVDYKVAQVSQWLVRSTPLGILLDPSADLAKAARVLPAADSPMPGQVAVLAQDPKRPDIGRILFFLAPDSTAPGGLRLTGWRVTDAQANLTVVELTSVRFNVPIAESRFRFRDPRPATRVPGKSG